MIPKVSVCVVTYNQEHYLETCLQSILDQDVDFPIEIIISDDASTDGTVDIINRFYKKYPDIIRPLLHPRNISAGVNFQVAHNTANGEFVAHCDGDDFFLPGKLKRQVQFLETNPEYVQVWHRQRLVDDKNNFVGEFPYRYVKSMLGKKLTIKRLAVSYGLVGQHSSQMYRRTARTKYENYPATIDYFYALDIAANGYSTQLDEFLGAYRIGNASTLTTTSHGKKFVETALVETARFYTDKFKLGKQFYGNLWVRRMATLYGKSKPCAEFEEGFQQFRKYRNIGGVLSSLKVQLRIHSSMNLLRIGTRFLKTIFRSRKTS